MGTAGVGVRLVNIITTKSLRLRMLMRFLFWSQLYLFLIFLLATGQNDRFKSEHLTRSFKVLKFVENFMFNI